MNPVPLEDPHSCQPDFFCQSSLFQKHPHRSLSQQLQVILTQIFTPSCRIISASKHLRAPSRAPTMSGSIALG